MKKALVVLLAVAMIFCFAATAMATTYSDMADQTDAAKDAVAFNSALGIIGGYPDGTFGPAKNITRAEFAKIAVNAAGLADSADYLKNTASKFSDVKVGAWYTGFVNLAQSQGYLQGYPDGTFRPNATITNQEVVTVLLRMLGYTDNLTGPWPVDYINQAVKLDLLDDVNFVGAVPATRADVAVMTKANLEQNVVDWDKDKDAFVEATKGAGAAAATYSLLKDAFGNGAVADGVVTGFTADAVGTDNALDMKAGYSVKDLEAKTFNLVATVPGITNQLVVDNNTVIEGGMGITELAGHEVTLIFNDPGKKQTIAYIDVTSEKKAVEKITYTPAATTIKLDDVSFNTVGTAAADVAAIQETAATNQVYHVFLNDDNEVYAVVADAKVANLNYSVVDEISAKGKLTSLAGNEGTFKKDAIFVKDGKQIAFTDLKKYDVLECNDLIKDSNIFTVKQMATGKLDSYKLKAAKINGTTYDTTAGVNLTTIALDADDATPDLTDYVAKEVKYVLDSANKIMFLFVGDATASNTVYGIVTDITTKTSAVTGAKSINTIDVFTSEGKTVTYTVVDDKYILLTGALNSVYASGAWSNEIARGSLVKFSLKEDGTTVKSAIDYTADVIKDNVTLAGGDKSGEVDKDKGYFYYTNTNKVNVTDKTVIFNVKTKDNTKTKALEVSLMTKADLMAGDLDNSDVLVTTADKNGLAKDLTVQQAAVLADGVDATYMVIADAAAKSDLKYGIIETLGEADADGGFNTVKFYGDDTIYNLKTISGVTYSEVFAATDNDKLIAYTQSGNDITPYVSNGFILWNTGAATLLTFEPSTAIADGGTEAGWDAYTMLAYDTLTADATVGTPYTEANSRFVVNTVKNGLVSMNDGTQFTITDDTIVLEATMTGSATTTIDTVVTDASVSGGDRIQYVLNSAGEAGVVLIINY